MENFSMHQRFKVIQGGAQSNFGWLEPPRTVVSRSVISSSAVAIYRLATEDIAKQVQNGLRQPILDIWWQIFGQIPPVNGSRRYAGYRDIDTGNGLTKATSAFRGLKRPIGEDDNGFDCFALITQPKFRFCYVPSMSCPIEPIPVSADLLYVTYVRIDFNRFGAYTPQTANALVTEGVVTHGEFVERSPTHSELPLGFKERYRRRIW
jgi:hypothetical protein